MLLIYGLTDYISNQVRENFEQIYEELKLLYTLKDLIKPINGEQRLKEEDESTQGEQKG
jgi:hypothetical protein